MKQLLQFAWVCSFVFLLVGCGGTPEKAPTPTATPEAQADMQKKHAEASQNPK
ncbi:MAG TPA: hypothetical protein VGM05_16610 [Planctomycetaceae bacterium]